MIGVANLNDLKYGCAYTCSKSFTYNARVAAKIPTTLLERRLSVKDSLAQDLCSSQQLQILSRLLELLFDKGPGSRFVSALRNRGRNRFLFAENAIRKSTCQVRGGHLALPVALCVH
jgi:hypothetical protein